MKFVEYSDQEMMMIEIAHRLAGELTAALVHEDRASLAVPGGTTPGPIFDALCAADLDWARVDVLLTDERWVPESSDRSNTRLLRARLLQGPAAKARLVPLYGAAERPEDRLRDLSATIEKLLPISVLLLGMGADMHTASLFPGADLLGQALAEDAPALLPMRAAGAPEPRITLTAPVLTGAMSKHIVITGAAKRDAVFQAEKLADPMLAPVSAVLGGATVHWAA